MIEVGSMRIEAISIRNTRVFKSAEFTAIPSMSVLGEANGSGRLTVFDIFGFLWPAGRP
jgi:predicted ATPase